ncbi:hypothetical protein BH23PLA1_BH23PLA1_01690 [soil metagenome]
MEGWRLAVQSDDGRHCWPDIELKADPGPVERED